jgi:hypothetical protein
MADDMEALRAKRMAELSQQYGVRGQSLRSPFAASVTPPPQGKMPTSQEDVKAEEERKRCAAHEGSDVGAAAERHL